jgi:hypothetical protein
LKKRAELFRYVGLDVTDDSLIGHYRLDSYSFTETVTFEGVGTLNSPSVIAIAQLWYLIAGLSYYKAGAAKRVDVGSIPLDVKGRALVHAALHDGLGEFAFQNDIPLDVRASYRHEPGTHPVWRRHRLGGDRGRTLRKS